MSNRYIAPIKQDGMPAEVSRSAPGVWRVRFGHPEAHTPYSVIKPEAATEGLRALPRVDEPPLDPSQWTARRTASGLVLNIPAGAGPFYGLGLQLKSFEQTGKKKTLRVNSDPVADTGDSHAPVPLVFTATGGWGVLVDTARYATFYLNTHDAPADRSAAEPTCGGGEVASDTTALYAARPAIAERAIEITIPAAAGVDVYLFAGPNLGDAVSRYNLFSGGGCLPPIWALGVWYRVDGRSDQNGVLNLARHLRERKIPCDVLGLEPGWHATAYSCSFTWSEKRFPRPDELINSARTLGYRLNLWEHVFVHPSSPIYDALRPHAGDHAVWNGLVPDFSVESAAIAFTDYHATKFVQQGVAGFKLDECDNSDFVRSPWSFPEHSRFPSGMDGEQMHSLLGPLYQKAIGAAFERAGKRTLSQARAAHAFAAPLPFVLYSDLYDHRDFIRGVCSAAFCGLLWSPEVRDAVSPEDLVRRIQTVALSPQALINAWYCPMPPWEQVNAALNAEGRHMEGWERVETLCRDALRLRMRLVPYLYNAFYEYHLTGRPPFRPLVMDYPDDPAAQAIDDQWLVGDDLIVAPVIAGQASRTVYLPGNSPWHELTTGQRMAGGQSHQIDVPIDRLTVLVRDGTLLPLADPVNCIGDGMPFPVEFRLFGEHVRDVRLVEDVGPVLDSCAPVLRTFTITAADVAAGRNMVERALSGSRWYRKYGS